MNLKMGSQIWLMGICFWLSLVSFSIIDVNAMSKRGEEVEKGTIFINGKSAIGKTDDDFICATLDWWPPEKCDYGTCSWDHASLLNLDLNNNIFLKAVKAFSPLKIRLGGTLQDKLIYGTDESQQSCTPFVRNTSEMFGFTQGCLPINRWDELNDFFRKSGAKITFGLNALSGRSINSDGSAFGDWNYTNAESFIRYTVQKNYTIHGWELGNELSGNGVGTRISADQYAADTTVLYNIVHNAYRGVEPKPLIIAPGGFFDQNWFEEFVNKTEKTLDVVTHHIYNLGPGVDSHLIEKILDPSYLDGEADTFHKLHQTLQSSGTSATSWVGEAGGAYNSGHHLITDAFVFSFWYLDQLGMASSYDTKTYCRQSLIGGNYGLLNTTTFVPNPDYYSALLWHRLMGRNVLSTHFSGTKKLRAYAHCAKHTKGTTLLLINLNNSTTIEARVAFYNISKTRRSLRPKHRPHRFRHEYHLTAKDGKLNCQTVLLNGKILTVNSTGDIPHLKPLYVNSLAPIMVAPFSIVFAHIPHVLPACREGGNWWN